jgi:hypothetical protein
MPIGENEERLIVAFYKKSLEGKIVIPGNEGSRCPNGEEAKKFKLAYLNL